jgi:ATP-binding cassette, subfamily B, bacterial
MSPGMGPVRMRSPLELVRGAWTRSTGPGAWELWRALPRARPYLAPYRKSLGCVVGLTVAAALLGLAEPWPLAVILNQVLHTTKASGLVATLFGTHPVTWVVLLTMVSARFSLIVFGNGVTVLSHYLGARTEQNMVLDLRSDLFEHAQRLSFTFHDRRQTGALMSQINLQAAAVGTIVMVIPPIAEALLTLVGMLVIALFIDWQIALVALVVLPFLFWSFNLYGRRIVPRLQRVQQLEWSSLSIVNEAMAMLRVIVSFAREDYEHARFRRQGQTAVDERVKLTVSQSLYTLGVQTASALGISIVMGLGAWHVIEGKLSIGELVVLITYITSVYQPLEQISGTVGTIHEQLVQFDSSLKLLDTEPAVIDRPAARSLERVQGRVRADSLSFAYPGRTHTLTDISFHARPGERVAVVGHTGAGKSTLMSLLIRFYDPDAGRIELDGLDIRDISLRSLREHVSVVLQEPLLFSGTIAENIRYGRLEASDAEVADAARGANAHEFISGLPGGYATEIGENGAQLSGGERQRICVARAFLKDAPILILDEPTSSIDSKTEAVVLDALDELMVGRTSFIIAHRLSTVRHADQILVMSAGRIVERGTHEQLLGAGEVYRQLHEAQTRQRRRPGRGAHAGNGRASHSASREAPAREPREALTWIQVGGSS